MTELTDTQTLVRTAQEAADGHALDRASLYAFRLGDSVQIVDTEKYAAEPHRKRGTVTVHDAASFIAYVKKHGLTQTEIYADAVRASLVAVINAHDIAMDTEEGAAGWGDHRVSLALHNTPAWQRWIAADRKLHGQVDFAEHVEDRIPDFVNPTGADMLELAQSFHATRSVKFDSSQRLKSSETQLRYHEEIDAKAGRKGDLAIPDTFELGLIPFEGAPAYKVTARLRYRITDGQLRIGYVLDRPEDVLRSAFLDIVNQVEEHVDQTVLRGVPA